MPLVPRVPPFERPASYDDLVKLPDHVVAEIVGGELHASPRPAPPHAVAYTRAMGLLGPAFDSGRSGPGGWWILAEPELHGVKGDSQCFGMRAGGGSRPC